MKRLNEWHQILKSFLKKYILRELKRKQANSSLFLTLVDSNQVCDKERPLPKQRTILFQTHVKEPIAYRISPLGRIVHSILRRSADWLAERVHMARSDNEESF